MVLEHPGQEPRFRMRSPSRTCRPDYRNVGSFQLPAIFFFSFLEETIGVIPLRTVIDTACVSRRREPTGLPCPLASIVQLPSGVLYLLKYSPFAPIQTLSLYHKTSDYNIVTSPSII